MSEYTQEDWYLRLPQDQQQSVKLSLVLYERELSLDQPLSDYSFVVFPMAKAYEGYLKTYFFSLNLITKEMYEGNRFRIGRALNPDISASNKDEHWLYDEVSQLCGESLARQLWNAWLECRNRVFHYYPEKNTRLSLSQSLEKITLIIEAIKAATACQLAEKESLLRNNWEN